MTTYPRRSLLYAPANDPSTVRKALASDADGVTIDLEDTISEAELPSARDSIAAVCDEDAAATELAVRINDLTSDHWRRDLEAAVAADVDTVRLPKVQSGRQVRTAVETARAIDGKTPSFILTLETPAGILADSDVAAAGAEFPEVSGISPGVADYARSTGAEPTADLRRFLDHRIVAVAAVGSLTPIAPVYTDIDDLEGLRTQAERSGRVGYVGQSAIHPDQIPVINDVFTPSADRVDRARRIVERFDAADSNSVTVDGTFVDTAVADRHRRLLERHRTIASVADE